jgi:hypothetical protein
MQNVPLFGILAFFARLIYRQLGQRLGIRTVNLFQGIVGDTDCYFEILGSYWGAIKSERK